MAISIISYNGYNAGITNKYPYTDFHEMNLDWLLTNYQSIIDKVNETIRWANEHQIEYEEALERLIAVEHEIDTFEQQITDAFNALERDLNQRFAQQQAALEQALADTQAQVDEAIRLMQQEVARQLADFVVEFQRLRSEVQAEINNLLAIVNRAIDELNNTLAANNEFMFEYIENRLQEFIDMIPDYEHIYVYNPYRGEVTELQQAINDIYSVAAIWGLTAAQYDSLGLTADEYDNLELTAIEYDTLGYKLLFRDPDLYMINPFTGEYASLKEVIMALVGLHRGDALTADEYDLLDLDADTYDAYALDAYDYDFSGKTLLV